jgi:hypothetical protein
MNWGCSLTNLIPCSEVPCPETQAQVLAVKDIISSIDGHCEMLNFTADELKELLSAISCN